MNETSLFGARLKHERKRLGLSQEQVAGAVGVSREMWGKYERGDATPGADVLVKLVQVGGDPSTLLVVDEAHSAKPESFAVTRRGRQLLEAYSGLTEDLQDAVDRLVGAAASSPSVREKAKKSGQVVHGNVGQVVKNMQVDGGFSMAFTGVPAKKVTK